MVKGVSEGSSGHSRAHPWRKRDKGIAKRRVARYRTRLRCQAQPRAHRLAVQDVALSRRKQGFESPWARQFRRKPDSLRDRRAGSSPPHERTGDVGARVGDLSGARGAATDRIPDLIGSTAFADEGSMHGRSEGLPGRSRAMLFSKCGARAEQRFHPGRLAPPQRLAAAGRLGELLQVVFAAEHVSAQAARPARCRRRRGRLSASVSERSGRRGADRAIGRSSHGVGRELPALRVGGCRRLRRRRPLRLQRAGGARRHHHPLDGGGEHPAAGPARGS